VSGANLPRRIAQLLGQSDGPFDPPGWITDGLCNDRMQPRAVIVDAITALSIDDRIP